MNTLKNKLEQVTLLFRLYELNFLWGHFAQNLFVEVNSRARAGISKFKSLSLAHKFSQIRAKQVVKFARQFPAIHLLLSLSSYWA